LALSCTFLPKSQRIHAGQYRGSQTLVKATVRSALTNGTVESLAFCCYNEGMNDLSTKAALCAEVLRHEDELIRASYLTAGLGISKQLVYYHLNQLVEQGILEKAGSRYALADKNKLIDVMMNANENNGNLKRSEKTSFLPQVYVESLQRVVDETLLCRAMDLPESLAVKTHVANEIQKTIDTLKKERHYLLNKQITVGSARKTIRTKGAEFEWYEDAAQTVEAIGYEFETHLKVRSDVLIDKMNEED
jgi:hypothetical protein